MKASAKVNQTILDLYNAIADLRVLYNSYDVGIADIRVIADEARKLDNMDFWRSITDYKM